MFDKLQETMYGKKFQCQTDEKRKYKTSIWKKIDINIIIIPLPIFQNYRKMTDSL